MAYTTAQLLMALLQARQQQLDALSQKGVEVDGNETFNDIANKIETISDTEGLSYGEWMPIENTAVFTITGIKEPPKTIGLSCEGVIQGLVIEPGITFIGMLSFDIGAEKVTFYKYLDDNTFVIDKVTSDLVCTVEQANDGTYTVSVSFELLNEMTIKPYLFKGGYEYNWVISSEEWFL